MSERKTEILRQAQQPSLFRTKNKEQQKRLKPQNIENMGL